MAERRPVLLISEDPLALAALARLLQDEPEEWLVLPLSPADAEQRDWASEPQAAIVDLGARSSAESSGILAAHAERRPTIALVSGPERALEALASGARGALSRTTSGSRLSQAIRAAMEGLVVLDPELLRDVVRTPPSPLDPMEALTPRELEVLSYLALGLSNKEIGERLGVSFHTVKFHVNSIMGKLGAQSRTEVVARAARAGLLTF